MTDKAYIVANEEQELEVLKKFEDEGLVWIREQIPTEWIPSERSALVNFPYVLIDKGFIVWLTMTQLVNQTIVYDGRKEENMSKKYLVTKGFMDELIEWRDDNILDAKFGAPYAFVDGHDIQNVPDVIDIWWTKPDDAIERNNRLIAIIQWLNGEDVFEVEELHKFVVRNDTPDNGGDYWFVHVYKGMSTIDFYISKATKFDTREEAQEWANSHQVVVEIDEEGNEVE